MPPTRQLTARHDQTPLRVGVIGVGHFGQHYVRLLRQLPGLTLAGTARNALEAQALINQPTLQAVVIATPPATHRDLTLAALAAGKHVVVEKPLALTGADARRLKAAAERSGRTVLVGHQYLYHDGITALREYLLEGQLGEVRTMYATHLSCGPRRRDYGVFWDAAPHALALVDYLFGPTQILDVHGVRLAMLADGPEDFSVCGVTFDAGPVLTLVASSYAPIKERRLLLAGVAGMALFEESEARVKLQLFRCPYPGPEHLRDHSSYFYAIPPEAVITPAVRYREPLANQLTHFAECIRSGHRPLTDLAHGERVTRWLEHIYQRLAGVPINPKS